MNLNLNAVIFWVLLYLVFGKMGLIVGLSLSLLAAFIGRGRS